MTAPEVERKPGSCPAEPARSARYVVWVLGLSGAALILILALSGASPWRPYAQGDDLSFEFKLANYYAHRLPSEGRWGVYAWHAVLGPWPRVIVFWAGLAAWTTSASVVVLALFKARSAVTVTLASIALATCPPALSLLQWPHTFVPMAFGVLGAAVALTATRGVRRLIALVLTSAALALIYQPFVLYAIGLCLVLEAFSGLETRLPSAVLLRRLMFMGFAGAAGAAVGLLCAYTLNWIYFDSFGIQVARWRLTADDANTALHILVLRNAFDTAWLLTKQTFGLIPAVLGGTVLVLLLPVTGSRASQTPGAASARALLALTLAGVAVSPFLLTLLAAAPVPPPRAGTTIWFSAVASLAAVRFGTRGGLEALVRVALAGLLFTGLLSGARPFARFSEAERQNRAIINQVFADYGRLPGKGDPVQIYVVGKPPLVSYAWGPRTTMEDWWIQVLFDRELALRRMNAKAKACTLPEELRKCAAEAPELLSRASTMPAYPQPGYMVRQGPRTYVKLGPLPAAPAPGP